MEYTKEEMVKKFVDAYNNFNKNYDKLDDLWKEHITDLMHRIKNLIVAKCEEKEDKNEMYKLANILIDEINDILKTGDK